MKTRILLVDDQNILRKGLRSLFSNDPNFEIVGEAENGKTACALVGEVHPDVVLMDLTMPVMNGIDATERITREHPTVKVIALSVHSDRRFIEKAMAVGATAYLRKACEFDELLQAIKMVMSNKTYISPGLGMPHALPDTSIDITVRDGRLTARERQILFYIASGKTTKEIASDLRLSVKSIEKSRHTIMEKINRH
ncbi:MAG TPA: response regulator transcription factor, partial [Bacteroidota bacterium]|nr:response regulator transcription factor [Bacteroidota bacterium]